MNINKTAKIVGIVILSLFTVIGLAGLVGTTVPDKTASSSNVEPEPAPSGDAFKRFVYKPGDKLQDLLVPQNIPVHIKAPAVAPPKTVVPPAEPAPVAPPAEVVPEPVAPPAQVLPPAVPAPVAPPVVGPYGSCGAARAAGAAPLYPGKPGWNAGLDRDKDGIACEG